LKNTIYPAVALVARLAITKAGSVNFLKSISQDIISQTIVQGQTLSLKGVTTPFLKNFGMASVDPRPVSNKSDTNKIIFAVEKGFSCKNKHIMANAMALM